MNHSLLSSFILIYLLFGCETTKQANDCFEFGTVHCAKIHQSLTQEERASEAGKKLRIEICSQKEIKCVDEKVEHPIFLKIKMAKEGYKDIVIDIKEGVVSGIFIYRGNDRKLRSEIEETLLAGRWIDDCEKEVLTSCEKLLESEPFLPGLGAFFQNYPKRISDNARRLICQNKNYKCISTDKAEEIQKPIGWTVIRSENSENIIDGKRSSKRELILRKDSPKKN